MAFADNTTGGRSVMQALAPCQVVLAEACRAGDLLGYSGGWKPADANNSVFAELVAVEDGASGDTIAACRVAVVGGFTGGTAGAVMYLSDTAGGYSDSSGAVGQVVGMMLTPTEMLVVPRYSAGGQLVVGAVKQFFRDSGLFIHSHADGKLKVSADGAGEDDIVLAGSVQYAEYLTHQNEVAQTLSTDTTLDATHSGKTIYVDTDGKTITLPATVDGLFYRIVNKGADGTVLVTISPNAADKIQGIGLTAADDKDLLNTKATARHGDFVELLGDGVDGWFVVRCGGAWVRQA